MMNNNSIPNKGDIIISPSTNRPIRVGSRVWLSLVKQGLVEGRYTDPKELGTIPERPEDLAEEISRIDKTLPRGQQSVRGRGKYKNKIVSRNKNPDTEDVSRYTAQMASKVVHENIESLAECEDLEAELNRLILQEMAIGGHKESKPKIGSTGRGRPPKQGKQIQGYKLEAPTQFQEESSSEDDDDEEEEDYFQNEDYSE